MGQATDKQDGSCKDLNKAFHKEVLEYEVAKFYNTEINFSIAN
jgi:hypothetical protein